MSYSSSAPQDQGNTKKRRKDEAGNSSHSGQVSRADNLSMAQIPLMKVKPDIRKKDDPKSEEFRYGPIQVPPVPYAGSRSPFVDSPRKGKSVPDSQAGYVSQYYIDIVRCLIKFRRFRFWHSALKTSRKRSRDMSEFEPKKPSSVRSCTRAVKIRPSLSHPAAGDTEDQLIPEKE
jgi:hypothetical protein